MPGKARLFALQKLRLAADWALALQSGRAVESHGVAAVRGIETPRPGEKLGGQAPVEPHMGGVRDVAGPVPDRRREPGEASGHGEHRGVAAKRGHAVASGTSRPVALEV